MKIRPFWRTAFSDQHKPWMVLCTLALLVFFVAASAAAPPKAKKLEDWTPKDWKKFGTKLASDPKVKKMSSPERAKYITDQLGKKYDAAGIKPNTSYFGKGRSGLFGNKSPGTCGDLTVNIRAALEGAGFKTGMIEVQKTGWAYVSGGPFDVNRSHGAPIVMIDGKEYVFDLWLHSGIAGKFGGFASAKASCAMAKKDWLDTVKVDGYKKVTLDLPPVWRPGMSLGKLAQDLIDHGATLREAKAAVDGGPKPVNDLIRKLKARMAKAEKEAKKKDEEQAKKDAEAAKKQKEFAKKYKAEEDRKEELRKQEIEKEEAIARLKEKIRTSKLDAEPENSGSQAGMTPEEWHEKLKKNDPEAWKKMGDALKSGDPDKIDDVIRALGAKSSGGEGGEDPLRDAEEESGGAAAAGGAYKPPASYSGIPYENPNSWVPAGREATAAERGESAQAANANRMGRIVAQGQSVDENIANAKNQHGSAESAAQGQRQRSSAMADAVMGGLTSGVAAGVDAAAGNIGAAAGNVVADKIAPEKKRSAGGPGASGAGSTASGATNSSGGERTGVSRGSNGNLQNVTVSQENVTLTFWDHGKEDGDIITLYLNGKVIKANIKLTKNKKSFPVTLNPGRNIFEVEAVNEGSLPPNTATVSISNVIKGRGTQIYRRKSGQRDSMRIYAPARPVRRPRHKPPHYRTWIGGV